MINIQVSRYETGLDKIKTTEVSVGKMQKELEALQPLLVVKSAENAKMLVELKGKQEEAAI